MKRYELDENGAFVCDLPKGQGAENWTEVPCPDGLINGRLIGACRNGAEWVGGRWVGDEESPVTREQVEQMRLAACADPVNGSDRFFTEALRREAAGDVAGAESAKISGQQRYEQIKAQYPWP